MTTSSDRWSQISLLFDELVELDADHRSARLAEIATADAAIADEVRALLAADEEDSGLLDSDAVSAVPGVLNRESDGAPADGMAGPYRLLSILGEGGMGVVWLAERTDGAYEQQVAVKILKRGMDTHAILRRFLQERRILARLHHPRIVRIVDGGMTADGRPFYVMDHVDGHPITQYAATHALDVRARAALLADVADAVAYAHTQLIVHRDLKPANVLVDADGEPRVLDFGIAKLIEESGEQTQTGTGLRVLSPAYAAPEQILGEAIGTATDVYALGLMLCELLTGQLPQRRGTTPVQLALDANQETVDRASTLATRISDEQLKTLYGDTLDRHRLARALSGDMDLIIATALQREPARRYPTAAAFADDLRRWLDGRPIAARADSAAYRLRKFVRRHRLGVAAGAIIALSLIGGLGVALTQAHKARIAATAALAAEDAARQQAAIATAVSDFLIRDVIQTANPYRNKLDIRLTDALIKGGDRIDERFKDNPRLSGIMHRELADALVLAGEASPAGGHAKLALDQLVGAFGIADPDALKARATLGGILHKQDKYDQARALYQSGLDATGKDTPVALRLALQVGLAGIDMEDRHEAEAVKTLDALLPQVAAAVGAFEPLHIQALDHEIRAYMGLDRFEEALALSRYVRRGIEHKFGVGDTQSLEWIKREGIVLTAMERYDDALPLMQQTCKRTRADLGEDHPATMDCDLRLGVVLFNQLRFGDATQLFEHVAAFRERTHGVDAETTWISWIWLARGYQRLDRLAKARALFERIRASAIRTLGDDNPNSLPYTQTLGMFLEQTGAHVDAGKLRGKLLQHARDILPPDHIMIPKFAWDVAETLASQQRDDDLIAFCAEWMPKWTIDFPAGDSRLTDMHKWLEAAQRRVASRKSAARGTN